MKIYLFATPLSLSRCNIDQEKIFQTLNTVANTTDTRDLVVALYLLPGAAMNRGVAYVRGWLTRENFITGRGKWSFSKKWDVPSDLPEKFKLIRMRVDGNFQHFPRTERDGYNWEFTYAAFLDHLATLFAHEIHHFRRYHLGLHPREGEHSADKWALNHVKNLGFNVEGRKLRIRKRKHKPHFLIQKIFPQINPFSHFRQLSAGAQLIVIHDPKRKYLGQTVNVVRPIRSNSRRIVIETQDGKKWRWPMGWLKIVGGENKNMAGNKILDFHEENV